MTYALEAEEAEGGLHILKEGEDGNYRIGVKSPA